MKWILSFSIYLWLYHSITNPRTQMNATECLQGYSIGSNQITTQCSLCENVEFMPRTQGLCTTCIRRSHNKFRSQHTHTIHENPWLGISIPQKECHPVPSLQPQAPPPALVKQSDNNKNPKQKICCQCKQRRICNFKKMWNEKQHSEWCWIKGRVCHPLSPFS